MLTQFKSAELREQTTELALHHGQLAAGWNEVVPLPEFLQVFSTCLCLLALALCMWWRRLMKQSKCTDLCAPRLLLSCITAGAGAPAPFAAAVRKSDGSLRWSGQQVPAGSSAPVALKPRLCRRRPDYAHRCSHLIALYSRGHCSGVLTLLLRRRHLSA